MGYNIIISGPSGAGKGTLIKTILNNNENYVKTVSFTTRDKRENEIDDVDYHFVTQEEFINLEHQDYFFETVDYDNNKYGIINNYFNVCSNVNYLFDVVVSSGMHIASLYPRNTILIYIMPTNLDNLNKQRGNRGNNRLIIGENEIDFVKKNYKYLIINSTPEKMYKDFLEIVNVETKLSIISNLDFINNYYNNRENGFVRKLERKIY